jgi:DNA-binding CsgD family transcriptional regulator
MTLALPLPAAAMPDARDEPALTERESEVARWVAAGLSNAQIAETMRISEHTVAAHLKRISLRLPGAGRTRERILRWIIRRAS